MMRCNLLELTLKRRVIHSRVALAARRGVRRTIIEQTRHHDRAATSKRRPKRTEIMCRCSGFRSTDEQLMGRPDCGVFD
jgi:hypothetical protein